MGFEPTPSAVQKRQDRLPEVSGACKMPANTLILCLKRFPAFQEIYSGCCTVAAQPLGSKTSKDHFNLSSFAGRTSIRRRPRTSATRPGFLLGCECLGPRTEAPIPLPGL